MLSRKKNAPDEKPIFQCIAMLSTALGPALTRYMHDVLDLMFQWGLSEPLRASLTVIAKHIPPLLKPIQGKPTGKSSQQRFRLIDWDGCTDRLLEMLSQILSGKPYRPLGAPPPRGPPAGTTPNLSAIQVSFICCSLGSNAKAHCLLRYRLPPLVIRLRQSL
jgi:hypothetical protein